MGITRAEADSHSMEPRVTVLMPVYNAGQYIEEAMKSILSQTFRNYEFLIINDGSTDNSPDVIRKFSDTRIRFVENESNMRLSGTLNKGIRLARGEYIARMDADDISLPTRFEKQVGFLDQNPDVALCGTWYSVFGTTRKMTHRLPTSQKEIECYLLFNPSFGHPTVMFRKSAFVTRELWFDEEYTPAEDYNCWVRFVEHARLANIPEVLLMYRTHGHQMTQPSSRQAMEKRQKVADRIYSEQLQKMGILPTDRELQIHLLVANSHLEDRLEFLSEVCRWLTKLYEANQRVNVYQEKAFAELLSQLWFRLCNQMTFLGNRVVHQFNQSPEYLQRKIENSEKVIFEFKSLIAWDKYHLHERLNSAVAFLTRGARIRGE